MEALVSPPVMTLGELDYEFRLSAEIQGGVIGGVTQIYKYRGGIGL